MLCIDVYMQLLYKGEAAFSFMMQNKPSHLLFVLNFNMETGQCVEPDVEMWVPVLRLSQYWQHFCCYLHVLS